MQKDFVETTNGSPIVHLLEKYDALELLEESSTLYPQILGLCEFIREGFNVIGKYKNDEEDIEITYEISPYSSDTEKLECTSVAPIEKWKNWKTRFPKDFLIGIVLNSPAYKINTKSTLTLYKEFIFKKDGLERNTAVEAVITNGNRIVKVYKSNGEPTRAYSDSDSDISHYREIPICRQQ